MTGVQPAALPPLVTIPDVDLVAAGTWELSTGEATFTTDDLVAAVDASQCPAVGAPVIKLGHTDPRFDGEPAVGRVTNMALAPGGQKVTGDLAGLPGWLGAVLSSAYPSRSIEGAWEFRCQIGHVHPFVVTALALLGTAPPGVGVLSSLDDVAALYGLADVQAANGDAAATWRLDQGGTMPGIALAAGVTTEDVRRAYYDSSSTPYSYWITEIQLDPPQLIVSDDATAKVYRVPMTIKGGTVTFGDAKEVQIEYVDVKASLPTALRWGSPAASRKLADGVVMAWSASTQLKNMGDDPSQSAIKKMFALPADTKSDSKLPHHTCSADGAVDGPDLGGCQAAIGVINGAHGGLTGVTAAEQKSAYNHLAAHVRSLGAEPAEYGGPAASASAAQAASEIAHDGHGAADGEHTHAHSAFGSQGGDATHTHAHSHAGDAQHNHAHANAGGNKRGGSEVEFTDEQKASLRAALGLAEDAELDEETLVSAAQAVAEKLAAPVAAGSRKLPAGVIAVEQTAWDEMVSRVKRGEDARAQQLREQRDTVIAAAVRAGKLPPARVPHWERLWDADPDGTREVLAGLKANVVPVSDVGSPGGAEEDLLDEEYRALFPPGAWSPSAGTPAAG